MAITAFMVWISLSCMVGFIQCYEDRGFNPLGYIPVFIGPQDGLKGSDKIESLPGQPEGVDFDQYSGYVTVDSEAGRALFYYFVESPQDSSAKPLVLWLNGGPGCSSFGAGAMTELGPFRVNKDGKTLYRNEYAWNKDANIIFLESPAGVGFSYSNTTSDYNLSGDNRTAQDSYTFLVNWLERFPEYKTRDFFITGESYAGHYVPQLAQAILHNNNYTDRTLINLRGIAMGNAYMDYEAMVKGSVDFYWTHALISDETYMGLISNCNFSFPKVSTERCRVFFDQAENATRDIYVYDIYTPLCNSSSDSISVSAFDPCSENYVKSYLNIPQVQKALHANVTTLPYPWKDCSDNVHKHWKDSPSTVLPIIQELMGSGIRVWIYSGDTDGAVPITCTRYAINKLGTPVRTSWYPWYTQGEVGGYAVEYQNLTFVTIRGSGHFVPSYQPARALVLFSSFLIYSRSNMNMKVAAFAWTVLLLSCYQLAFFPVACSAHQIDSLDRLLKSRKSANPPRAESWGELDGTHGYSTTAAYVEAQDGRFRLMQDDKIDALPGQPEGVDFDQYGGYVTVDQKAGRALFYYFVESPQNSSTRPLVLWLNGGPGCSSLGYGAMEELGPFRVNSDGKTLFRNPYAWNNVANVIFLESPAGVGFSYSNTSSDYSNAGDKSTAEDSYKFLVNWLERFPQYKSRDFFITGESYAGHYVPQLAYTILSKKSTTINLKGIAIGNAWIDDNTGTMGIYDYFWTHALNSDETNEGIHKSCDFVNGKFSSTCYQYQSQGDEETGVIDVYNIYAPICNPSAPKVGSAGSVNDFDPCSDDYVSSYLNLAKVQKALHAKATSWGACSNVVWTDSPTTILPTIKQLIAGGINVWIYSGDMDGRVPITSSRYAINTLKLLVDTAWRPWYSNNEVGGYVVGYKGVVLTTVRGAGHMVPSYQPERALTMISSFLQGILPPSS
ncbi:hypothetical protein L1049_026153 [Liquidambar formosana]|uniref:Carboxypeptidase n=1 Tax=Liquidambar formosana TaxID=63359 RepID=A0AAP0NC85_LIQFO